MGKGLCVILLPCNRIVIMKPVHWNVSDESQYLLCFSAHLKYVQVRWGCDCVLATGFVPT